MYWRKISKKSPKTPCLPEFSAQEAWGIIPRHLACSSCWSHPCPSSLSCSSSFCSNIFWLCRSSRWGWAVRPPQRWRSEPTEELSVSEQHSENWDWTVISCQVQGILNLNRNWDNVKWLLTWDFINFIQEFAFDFFKHVILVDLCVVGAGSVWHRGGDESWSGRHARGGGTSGLSGRHSLWPSEQIELHCHRLGAASLRKTEGRRNNNKQL